jgi:hypothetical protein
MKLMYQVHCKINDFDFYPQIFRDFEMQITAKFYQRKSADIKIISVFCGKT